MGEANQTETLPNLRKNLPHPETASSPPPKPSPHRSQYRASAACPSLPHRPQTLPTSTLLSPLQQAARYLLAAFLLFTGADHLSFLRKEFQAQAPDWAPMSKDTVVVLSGFVELGIAGALASARRKRVFVGIGIAVFFVLIFPGNWAQYIHHRDAFGMNTDTKRFIRLLLQPVLVLWVLWATGIRFRGDNLRVQVRF